ncbi:lpqS family protein [Mycobacterium kansasii 732]|nr:lpqS family protein [Mycobacterium kansasii 732]
MSLVGAAGLSRPKYAVAAAAAVWMALWVVIIGAHNSAHGGLLHSEPPASHPPHALISTVGAEYAVNVDHPHVGKGSSTAHHEQFMTAVLPRSASTLVALGVMAALVAAAGWLIPRVVLAGRGRPRRPVWVSPVKNF